jgi:hypothetical protein
MKLYRYSPIDNLDDLRSAIEHVARTATKMYFSQTGNYPDNLIKSLTIFSHFEDEYKKLVEIANTLGSLDSEHNGPYIKLQNPILLQNGSFSLNGNSHQIHTSIEVLRIRKPDPYRMQVGCCDLEVPFDSPDFESTKTYPDGSESPRYIKRTDMEMIEFFDLSTDVLAYVVD